MTDTCPHGHPWTPDNVRLHRNQRGYAQRECRECHRQRMRDARDARWLARHAGHDYTRDSLDRRRCLTCRHPSSSRDVDPIAVERAIKGEPPPVLSVGDIAAAVQALEPLGLSSVAVAKLIGCSDRTVQRIRAREREAAAA